MKKIIFLLTLCLCEQLHAEDLIFSCKGSLSKEYVGKTSQKPIEIKENVGVIIKNSEVFLSADTSMMRIPTQYSSSKIKTGFNFPICSKQNHKISFDNFACNYGKTFNRFKNSMTSVDLVEGSFDGITNKLVITMKPTNEKIDALEKRKSGFYSLESGEYQCVRAKPLF